ncbi:phage major capsid protein [Rhodanobacter sp. Col0626]|uniref:phage major capsid protein n=1 Tax=Rhodanobacter sp. Col0626 TaxID=3415679 RepID=UPI003CF882E8
MRAAEIAEAMPGGQRVAIVLRSAIAAGTVADAVWAGPLVGYQSVASSFIESLRSISVFDRMLADLAMRRVPLKTRLAVSSVAALGAEVGEWEAVPVSSLAIAGPGLSPRKVQALIAVTNEVIDGAGSAGSALLARELRAGVASATDGAFLSGLVTTGTATIAGTASPLADLGNLLDVVNTTGAGWPYLVVDARTANRLATKTTTGGDQAFPGMTPKGGELAGVPVLVSDGAPAADSNGYAAMLIDASAIVGDSETVTVDASEQAALQMMSNPGSGAQSMVSMFQTNSTALLASRWFGFELTRDSGVAVVTGAAW